MDKNEWDIRREGRRWTREEFDRRIYQAPEKIEFVGGSFTSEKERMTVLAIFATHNKDGSIHVTPVWYLFENGKFFIGSPSSSRKARNVAARPDATIMVDIRQPGSERWVYASGCVEILRGDESQETNSKIMHRYLTQEAIEDYRIGPAFATADDITLCLIPETWRSWSAKGMDEQYFGGILSRAPEKWFRPIDN